MCDLSPFIVPQKWLYLYTKIISIKCEYKAFISCKRPTPCNSTESNNVSCKVFIHSHTYEINTTKRFKRRGMNSEYRTGYSSAQLPHRYDHSWRRIPLHISGWICIRKFNKYWGNENHKIEIIDFPTKFYAASNKTLNVLIDRYW